jgi:endonuclease/exonuclease/phosphatase family metal-dependent hydrolase
MRTPHKIIPLALAALMLVPATALAGSSRSKTTDVTFMSRNLYLGADIITLASATDRNDFEQKAAGLFQTVQRTDFESRAPLIADEIRRHRPDFIGLQEVALWRRGPDGVKDGSRTPARQVVYDWLDILDGELKERNLRYRVVRKQTEFDFEGPTALGYDVRFTQQDAVLVRVHRDIKTRAPLSRNFNAALQVPIASIGETANVRRGWVGVEGTVRGAKFRFVNTHLEAYSEPIGLQQARELTRGPLRASGQRVLVGDMNSERGSDNSDPIDHLLGFGFDDTFFTKTRRDTKTCCQSETLDNAQSQLSSRIDFVLARPKVPVVRSVVVGNDPDVKTANGLWTSDHAGVVSKLRLRMSR